MIKSQLVEQWQNIPVAVLVDADVEGTQIDPEIRPLNSAGKQPFLFGKAVTAKCEPPDFGSVLKAADLIKTGDVLVIAADGDPQTAMIGEIISGVVRRNGGRGIICDGAIRDVGEIGKWEDFSVFTRHITPRGPTSAEHISVNVPVQFGGQTINPGDLILGDDDGLAKLAPDQAEQLLGKVNAKLELEQEWQAKLRAGETVKNVFNLP